MSGHMSESWKTGRDLFGALHVYIDETGERLTNDRMCGTEGWDDIARLIASAPDLLEALVVARGELQECAVELTGEDYNNPKMNAAIAKALGNDPR